MSQSEPLHRDHRASARRLGVVVLVALLVVAVPVVLTGNALWALLTPLTIDLQYALPGFPVDPNGVQDPERTGLAKLGVDAIRPGGEGVALLEQARLASGRAAFAAREVQHMADVRGVVAAVLTAWAVGLVATVGVILALRRLASPAVAWRALLRGAVTTLALVVLTGAIMAVDFDWFFVAFHELLFEPGTWWFGRRFSLRQLYPDAFWAIAGAAVAMLVLLQATALALVARSRLRAALEP